DDLLPADTNGTWDVYIRDLVTNGLELVSATPGGAAGNSFSRFPYISANGRWVTFITAASDIASPMIGYQTLVVRDRCFSNGVAVPGCSPTTEMVSVATDGTPGNGNSDDFHAPGMSDDGSIVAFESLSNNLVSPPVGYQIFARDRRQGTTTLV